MEKKRFLLAVLVLGFFFLSGFLGFLLYKFLHRTQVERYFSLRENFAILLAVKKSRELPKLQFLSVVLFYPETARLGFISFFPETKWHTQEKPISVLFGEEGEENLSEKLSQILGVKIPFYVSITLNEISRFIDLVEGVPFFLPKFERQVGEIFPEGEFILDGFLVKKYLNPTIRANEYTPAFLLFRHYSLFLNLWKYRQEKWEMLRHEKILPVALLGVKTNLPVRSIIFLGEQIFAKKGWLPLFLEIPVKRVGDDFIMEQEASALYLKNFRRQLSQKENPFLQEVPKMEIKNGTLVPNLARDLRANLVKKGISILEFSNADRHDYPHTILLDTGGNVFFLESLSRMLQIHRTYHVINRSYFTDLILILGADYKNLKWEK